MTETTGTDRTSEGGAPRPGGPVSVILPTREWGPVASELAAQLRPGDELLVVCDRPDDPVATRRTPGCVEVVTAGDPSGCSGKANAVAAGMERASNDRFVWTDDDFEHGPDWLDRLVAAGREHGPATAVPRFIGGGWWRPLEVVPALTTTLGMTLGVGDWAGNAWGGGVVFTREDLDVNELVADLRQGLSDDGILSEHLGEVHPVDGMQADVIVPGDFRTAIERTVRFIRLVHVHEGLWGQVGVGVVLAAIAALFPLPTAIASTALVGVSYAYLGMRRPSFCFAYPMLFALPVLLVLGIVRKEFEWAGRRYRLDGPTSVQVIDDGAGGRRHDDGPVTAADD